MANGSKPFSVNRPLNDYSGTPVTRHAARNIAPPSDDGTAEIGSTPGYITPPGDDGTLIGNNAPIGDAVIPLAIMTLTYALVIYRKTRNTHIGKTIDI